MTHKHKATGSKTLRKTRK